MVASSIEPAGPIDSTLAAMPLLIGHEFVANRTHRLTDDPIFALEAAFGQGFSTTTFVMGVRVRGVRFR